jgi:multidrug efflux pump subunit AcrA (membrane-fusion protein)
MVHRHLSPVNTRAPGFIKEIRFDEFQFVHKGDTLVVIEDAEFRLALAQAEAGVKGQKSSTSAVSAGMSTTHSNVRVASAGIDEARIQMENAQKDYQRFEQLLQKEAVTRQQYDNVKAQYEAAKARYEAARSRQQATSMVLGEQQQRLGQSAAGESVAEAQLNLARLNLSYTVMGEVNKPGNYKLDKDAVTLLEALGKAGDLNVYGKRDSVLVIRQKGAEKTIYSLSLTNAKEIFSSEAYYVQQNDVIYVKANETKARQSNVPGNESRTLSFWLTLASVLTALGVLIFK